jgi:hypothetical protein
MAAPMRRIKGLSASVHLALHIERLNDADVT